ncbi:MAG: cytochrome c [Pseudomonadales bacterium]
MRNVILLVLLTVAFAAAHAQGLGVPVDAASIDDITVFPDGAGLPPGQGNVVDGEALYQTHCLACHGVNGQNGGNDRLAGGKLPAAPAIGSYWPYATTLFDYVRRAMPYPSPGILSDQETYSVVAYLLHLNGLLDAHAVLDAQRLAGIRMPNRDNFVSTYPLPH